MIRRRHSIAIVLWALGSLAYAENPEALKDAQFNPAAAVAEGKDMPVPEVGEAAAVKTVQETGTYTEEEAPRMKKVFDKAETLAGSGKKVLLAFDIDKTLMTANQDLGDEPWFDDLYESIKTLNSTGKPEDKALFGKRLGQLLELYFKIANSKEWGSKLVEEDAGEAIKRLQTKGVKIIALTSRTAPDLAEATIRQFKDAGVDFSQSNLGQDQENLKTEGLSRPVTYKGGVALTSGQDKGKVLLSLLKNAQYQPDFVIFVDNKSKYLEQIHKATEGSPVNVINYRYSGTDGEANDYHKSDKAAARVQLKAFVETGRILSNEEASKIARTNPVSIEEANTLIFGTPNPLQPDPKKEPVAP